ncbi:MAG: MMPL family transporter [Planctomycetia bacterium]|nr:MMPL family transporter [Planctomycetia bacterium]
MYKWLGQFVARWWLAIIIAWAALVPAAAWFAPAWDSVTNDGDLAYLPERMTSVRGERLMAQAFPENRAKSQFVIVAQRAGGMTAEDLQAVERLGARFAPEAVPDLPVDSVWTPESEVIGRKLVSRDHRAALVMINLAREFMTVANIRALKRAQQVVEEARQSGEVPDGLTIGVTGSAAIGGDMLASAAESIRNIEWSTVILVVIILLVVYRAPLLALIPLAAIAVSLVIAMDLVALLTQVPRIDGMQWFDFKIFKTTKIFIIVILFGSGTDYCLFLISRYREELQRGLNRRDALATAVEHISEAVLGSALTTIFGLGMMFFADFGKFSNSGPTIALCLTVTLAACLTLAPALLRAAGRLVFWPAGVAARGVIARMFDSDTQDGGLWDRVARAIIARPGLILAGSVLVLLPFAYKGWREVPISYNLIGELAPDRPSVSATKAVREHFPGGELGPITILVYHDRANFHTEAGEQQIARLTKQLYDLPGVASVRSITEPLGDKPGTGNTPLTAAGRRKLAARKHPRTEATYLTQVPDLAGQVARLDVVTEFDPFSRAAANLLDDLDGRLQQMARDPDSPWYGAEFDYCGTAAGTRDLRAVTESDQRLIERLVLLAVYFVLIALLRRPLISIYLVLSVLFTYYVTIGATEMLCVWVYPDFDGLDWKVPLFLFVILIAVGEDYNIYLASRVLEEQRNRRGLIEGLRVAVVRTGGIITSCGVIMAGSFVSMMTGTLRGIVELGFALSLGILLDTAVVRPVLVPAFLALLWRRRDRESATGAEDGAVGKAAEPAGSRHMAVAVPPSAREQGRGQRATLR